MPKGLEIAGTSRPALRMARQRPGRVGGGISSPGLAVAALGERRLAWRPFDLAGELGLMLHQLHLLLLGLLGLGLLLGLLLVGRLHGVLAEQLLLLKRG